MPDLTDEEKAELIAGGKVENTEESEENKPNREEQPAEREDEAEEKPEKPANEEESDQPATFTKQFNNLKGDSWDSYGPELETAYQNSFTEGLRLKKELDEARLALANPPKPEDMEQQQNTQLPPEVQQRLAYVDSLQRHDMDTAFNKFREQYPQVLDQSNFDRFQKIATPVGSAFLAENGREPTYPELFDRMAGYLGWTATDDEGRRAQSLKENLGSGSPATGQSKGVKRGPAISDAEVDTYLRFFAGKSREDAIKELVEAKASK